MPKYRLPLSSIFPYLDRIVSVSEKVYGSEKAGILAYFTCSKSAIETPDQYCMKYAQIRTFCEQYFPVLGQNRIRIRGSIRITESPYFGIFHIAQDEARLP